MALRPGANEIPKGALCAAVGFSLFALGDSVFKYLGPWYPITVTGFWSSLFSLAGLLVFAALTGGVTQALRTRHLKLHLLRGFLSLFQFLLSIYTFTHLPLTKAYALIFIAPFLTTLLSIPLLKEKAGWREWAAIAGGFAGVLTILRPGMVPVDVASAAALGAALLFSAINIISRLIGRDGESIVSFGLYVEFVIIPALLALLVLGGFAVPAPAHLGLLALAGLLGATGLVCVAAAFTRVPAAVAAPFHYIQMLWAIGLGYAVFGDRLDIWTAGGATLIIGSGLWLIRAERDKAELPGAPV